MTRFAELAITTNFSFLRGGSHPEELVMRAAALGLAGIAVTDRNTLAGVVRGHVQAKETGFRCAVGARLAFRDGTPDILAWPTDRAAYGRLCRLLTRGNRRAAKGDCHLDLPDLLEWGKGMMLGVMPGRDPGHLPLADAGRFVPPSRSVPRLADNARSAGSVETIVDGRHDAGHDGSLAGSRLARGRAVDEPVKHHLTATLAALREAFPENVRLMASRLYGPDDRRRLAHLDRLARHFGIPLLATNDVLYHVPERRPLQDVLTCIREHRTIFDAGRLLEANAERHLKDAAEMARLFADLPEAVAESRAVLERLAFSLDELRYQYPDEPTGDAASPQEALIRLVEEGARQRYPDGVPNKVRAALDHELRLIGELNYAPYFLTVHDIVRFAKEKGILAQGRGSAANSAVCFVLGITEVDPDRSELLFERFISAERNEPPDIDVDFEHERREEVIQYIYAKYGRHRAGLAATVISYRTRSAVREVGKVFGLSDDTISALSGTIWGWSSAGVREADIRRIGLDPAERTMRQVAALSQELIGFPRHLSQHVGGFVMTRDRLDEMVPVMNAAMEDRTTVEWDKDDLDALCMLKVDVLALGMLSCIRRALDFMAKHYGKRLALADIPAEDPAVYRMLCRADSLGVFQVESRAQMTMLPRLRPQHFYDLVIEVAIVRPGPIQGDMVHPYLRRRQGLETVSYPSPAPEHGPPDELERVLGRTLGVPLFQEQAMKIAIVAAGFTPGEADRLRRAMATFKRTGTIGNFRTKMIEGMVARGYARDFAERCFRQIEGFGEYGFPESHAASFALLVYASSWIKCHYPDVFCAALLNAQPMGFYAPAQIVRDATRHGIAVRPVDVNFSDWDATLEAFSLSGTDPHPASPLQEGEGALRRPGRFHGADDAARREPPASPPPARGRMGGGQEPVRQAEGRDRRELAAKPGTGSVIASLTDKPRLHPVNAEMAADIRSTHAVRLGFRQIKGFREADADALVSARGKGYDSVRHLWLRSGLSRAAIERLAEADAFRSLGLDRRDALWAARELGGGGANERLPLFDTAVNADIRNEPDFALPPMPPGEHVVNDYRSLSLSLKAHPLSFVRERLAARGMVTSETLRETPNGKRVSVAGLAIVRQRPGTASGVIFMTIEDETDIANIVVWPKVFERFRPVVLGARLVAVSGKVQSESGVIHVIADRLDDLTHLLAVLSAEPCAGSPGEGIDPRARADEARRPGQDHRERAAARAGLRHPRTVRFFETDPQPRPADSAGAVHAVMPKGRNFH
jgi:error-prone DNA polymerase